MKQIAFVPGILFLMFALNSCCSSGLKSGHKVGKVSTAWCGQEHYEDQVTEWVEEEVMVDSGEKGGMPVSTTVRRPVVTTVQKKVKCGDCGSWYCTLPGCCGTVSRQVLKRATAQGGTGEPHMGQIPTMKVLAP